MPNSFDQNVRGALEQRLATVTGIPTIVHEGEQFSPQPGAAHTVAVIVPTSERPASMGDDHYVLHEGLFMVSLVYPNRRGTAAISAMANLVKEKFKASDLATLNDITVRFRYAERRPTVQEPDWIRVPIAIGWFVYANEY